jgi:Na+-translocating ferredoxin:NAD+ oxidoreductase RnfC subunit
MSIINGLSITNILDIIKLLNNSDEIRKYFKIIYNKFCLETTMNAINFATNKALIQTENALNKAIENIKIVKPLKTSKYPDFDKLWDNTINSLIIS